MVFRTDIFRKLTLGVPWILNQREKTSKLCKLISDCEPPPTQKKWHEEDEQESNRNSEKTKDHEHFKTLFHRYFTSLISKQLDERETTHIHLWFKYTGNPGPLIVDLGDWESKETGQPGHQALELSFSPVGGYVDLERSYNNKLLKPPKMKAMRYIVLHLDRNVLISSTLV